MNSEEKFKWSKEYALKKRISLILKSPKLGYWRICGKTFQKEYVGLLKSCEDSKLNDLLTVVVITYENCINNMEVMTDKERKVKLKNLHKYAEGRF